MTLPVQFCRIGAISIHPKPRRGFNHYSTNSLFALDDEEPANKRLQRTTPMRQR
jgi:hypothetical protein